MMRVRERLWLSLGLMGVALLAPPWPSALLVVWVATMLALADADITPRRWARALGPPLGFLLVATAAQGVRLGDVTAGAWVAWQWRGVQAGWPAALRAMAVVAAVALSTASISSMHVAAALRALRVPAGAVDVLLLAWRVVGAEREAVGRRQAAARLRGASRSWWNGMRAAGLIGASLAVTAHRRAQRLEVGLAARGLPDWSRQWAALPPARGAVLWPLAAALVFWIGLARAA